MYVVIRHLLLLRDKLGIPKLTFHSDLLHFTLEKNPTFQAKTLRSAHRARQEVGVPPQRPPVQWAPPPENAHIESPSDTPSLPVSIAATVNFAQMQTKAANDC